MYKSGILSLLALQEREKKGLEKQSNYCNISMTEQPSHCSMHVVMINIRGVLFSITVQVILQYVFAATMPERAKKRLKKIKFGL
jgi:hypothetical protein